jgi:predicted transcriptional regulator
MEGQQMATYKLTAKSASALTSEQRSKMSELADKTSCDVRFLLRHAVSNFLKYDAPLWIKDADTAGAVIEALCRTSSTLRDPGATRLRTRHASKRKAQLESNSILEQIRYLDPERHQ